MRNRTDNFSAHIRTNTRITKEQFDTVGYNITSLSGCNGPILSAGERFLYLFIPKSEVANIEKESNKSFSDIMLEISKFGFVSTVFESIGKNNYVYYSTRVSLENSIIIELDLTNYNNARHRYYAFCMFRHLYYCQNILLEYLNIVDKNDTEEERIKKLSWSVGKGGSGGYTFLPYFITKNYKISYLLEQFDKYGNQINNLGIYYTDKITTYEKDLEKVVKLENDCADIGQFKYKFISIENSKIAALKIIQDNRLSGVIKNITIINSRWENYAAVNLPEEFDKYLIKKRFGARDNNSVLTYNNTSIVNTKRQYINSQTACDHAYEFNITRYLEDNDSRPLVTVDIKSRHPSHAVFRKAIKSKRTTLIRLGSVTPTNKKYDLVINKEEAIKNSSSKLLMKQCFNKHGVITPEYVYADNIERVISSLNSNNISFPIIAKNIMGSRGTGNYKIDSVEELTRWSKNRTITNYIFEKFKNFAKEYRIHVSTEGVFLMWRKLRRNDTPDNQKWFFNNINCNWISTTNDLFDAPTNLKDIQNECMKALHSVGLDFGACDVRVQSNLNKEGGVRKGPIEFSIIEINSAPSMSPVTTEAYLKEFVKLIDKK